MNRTLAFLGGVAFVVVIGIYMTFFTVQQTEIALVLQLGKPIRVIDHPGLQVKWPLVQNVVIYDRRILDFEPPAEEVIASDQKRLIIDTYARFKIIDPLLFYQSVGTELAADQRLSSIISASLRRIIGNVELQAVISTQRANIMKDIREDVNKEAKGFGIDVVDVRLRRADLPQENEDAIYARMKTERQREAAQYRAQGAQQAQQIRADADRQRIEITADAQRQAQILRGEGDAQSITIYADAYGKDPAFFSFYRSLQAYKEALSGPGTTYLVSPDSEFFKYFEAGPSGAATPGGSGSPAGAKH
ncbi:MAG TPA: protease modulator HflC [Stellaceae bacterium]|jgi:membrane protease subunit HflC|nr:protease modulator HflC [Stellaceae bacterium]